MSADFSNLGELLDDSITYLGCSDCRLSPAVAAHFMGHVTMATVRAAMLAEKVYAEDLDRPAHTPTVSRLLFAPSRAGALLELVVVERLGTAEVQRLNLLGVAAGRGPLCRARHHHVMPDGSVPVDSVLYHSFGGRWLPVGERHYRKTGKTRQRHQLGGVDCYEELEVKTDPLPTMAATSEWARRHVWSVEFRLPEAPGVWLSTDPTGIKALLRMRDVPEGRSRREALTHWVSGHWRQLRSDPDTETRVREHLRGQDRCTWFGLDCVVVPSTCDVVRNEEGRLRKVRERRRRLRRL